MTEPDLTTIRERLTAQPKDWTDLAEYHEHYQLDVAALLAERDGYKHTLGAANQRIDALEAERDALQEKLATITERYKYCDG